MPEDEVIEKKQEIALEKLKWSGRRKMAWLSLLFWFACSIYLLGFKEPSEAKLLEGVYSWVSMGIISIVCAYMGFTTYASWKGK